MERLLLALICAPILLIAWVAEALADYLGRRKRRARRAYAPSE